MKLEILMKLIALANNNPNDNEANLAARKACKAIIEHKFVITGGTVVPPKTTTPPKSNTPPRHTTSDPFRTAYGSSFYEEFFSGFRNKQYAGDSQRRYYEGPNEPPPGYQKYKPKSDELKEREHCWQYEYYVAQTRQFWNPLTKKHYNKMFQDLWYEETGTRHVSDTAAFRASANYGRPEGEGTYKQTTHTSDDKYYQRRKERGFGDEERRLKCNTCGLYYMTKFVGAEHAFKCNECTWTEFEKGKQPPKEEKNYGHVCHMTGKKCSTPVTCHGMGCQIFIKR